ncbi:hypothetical protein [Streptomyces sp. NPDC047315]|uniref:hypothetical protein n=1 Tax=Streptomyces sp. NPDC047315 TaxID=3155142 RepID=UPI0033C129F2
MTHGLLAATWSAGPAAVAAVAAKVHTAIEADIAAECKQFQQITDLADLEAAGPDAVEDTATHNAFLAAESAVAETSTRRLGFGRRGTTEGRRRPRVRRLPGLPGWVRILYETVFLGPSWTWVRCWPARFWTSLRRTPWPACHRPRGCGRGRRATLYTPATRSHTNAARSRGTRWKHRRAP